MCRLTRLLLCLAFSAFYVNCIEMGPKYPATKGELWPKAQSEKKGKAVLTFDRARFSINVTNNNCSILWNAAQRCLSNIKGIEDIATRERMVLGTNLNEDTLKIMQLQINLTQPCEGLPRFGMDESYNMTVWGNAIITSASVWGIIRGLESFSQLFYISDSKQLSINTTEVVDYPQYPHRGIMLDTSRHYVSLANILKLIDAMSMNKMNVFHWHIVDDQSFPYQSEKFPEISAKGAYHPTMIYTKSDIQMIINYARNRGVLPEFDVPGHTRSWGAAHPDLLAKCNDGSLGPMNPTRDHVYNFMKDFFQDVQTLFPDKFVHLGGDEVDYDCWSHNSEIEEYMKKNNISSARDLHALFMKKTIPLLAKDSSAVVWQEVYDENVPLSPETIVHVWKEGWHREITEILKSGHRALFSSEWYLDHLNQGVWDMYGQDPRHRIRDAIKNETLLQNIVGGEACMWGEMIDDRNFLSRTWPRASAVAEVLWSMTANSSVEGAYRYHRMEEHACRMIRRGVPAEPPSGPGFCVV